MWACKCSSALGQAVQYMVIIHSYSVDTLTLNTHTHPGHLMSLTLAYHFQGRQKVVITHHRDGQKHVENKHEVDDESSILPLLHGEEAFRELGRLR